MVLSLGLRPKLTPNPSLTRSTEIYVPPNLLPPSYLVHRGLSQAANCSAIESGSASHSPMSVPRIRAVGLSKGPSFWFVLIAYPRKIRKGQRLGTWDKRQPCPPLGPEVLTWIFSNKDPGHTTYEKNPKTSAQGLYSVCVCV
jgi:hypothetical protein